MILTIIKYVVWLTERPAFVLASCIFLSILALLLSTMVLSHVSKTRLATDDDSAADVEGDCDDAAAPADVATDCGVFIAENESSCIALSSFSRSVQKSLSLSFSSRSRCSSLFASSCPCCCCCLL